MAKFIRRIANYSNISNYIAKICLDVSMFL